MELLIKLAALSLCVSAVTALLKKSDEALSLLLLLAAVLIGCAMLLPALSDLFDFCERVLLLTDLPLTLFVPVVKVTAIALVARFSCALCADAGQSALSSLLAAALSTCIRRWVEDSIFSSLFLVSIVFAGECYLTAFPLFSLILIFIFVFIP